MRRTRIVDHRGKVHWLCRVEDLPEGASRELWAVVSAANSHRLAYALWTTGIMGAIVLLVFLLQSAHYREIAIYIALGAVANVLVSMAFARRFARRAGKVCLEAGLCAACGYQVAGSCAVEADGCLVCPECGAAWLSEGSELNGNSSGAGELP